MNHLSNTDISREKRSSRFLAFLNSIGEAAKNFHQNLGDSLSVRISGSLQTVERMKMMQTERLSFDEARNP